MASDPKIEGHLQRLERIVATIGVARIIGLAHSSDEMVQAAARRERRSQREEQEVASGHECVGQPVFAQRDLGVACESGLADLAQHGQIEQMIGPEPILPYRMNFGHPGAVVGPTVEFDAVALPLIEPYRLNCVEAVERPCKAGRAVLPTGEENEGAVSPAHAAPPSPQKEQASPLLSR